MTPHSILERQSFTHIDNHQHSWQALVPVPQRATPLEHAVLPKYPYPSPAPVFPNVISTANHVFPVELRYASQASSAGLKQYFDDLTKVFGRSCCRFVKFPGKGGASR